MSRQEHTERTLEAIARRVDQARRSTNRMGILPHGEGENLLCDLEHLLVSLVTLVGQEAQQQELEGAPSCPCCHAPQK